MNGTNQLVNVEDVQFSTGDRTLAVADTVFGAPIERVFVRPIIVANSDGSNAADSLGSAEQAAEIFERVDLIFAQSNVDIEFLDSVQYNNTFANVGDPNAASRPLSDFNQIISQGDAAGVGSSDARVVDLYFVRRNPGQSVISGDGSGGFASLNGLAFVGQSGITIQVDEEFDFFSPTNIIGRQFVATVVAHEIGHTLG